MSASLALSPCSMLSAINRARICGLDESSGHARCIEEVTMYRCPECRELHEWESDAEKCCKVAAQDRKSDPRCPCCGALYATFRDAADCCLWHDLDAYTRWMIADAVEAGSDWVTELGLLDRIGAVAVGA